MSTTYRLCPVCHEFINLDINHYVAVATADADVHYLHHRPCAEQFAAEHQVTVLTERLNRESSLGASGAH